MSRLAVAVACLLLATTVRAHGPSGAAGSVAFQLRGKQAVRSVVAATPNRVRREYPELDLEGGSRWLFRPDMHLGVYRTKQERAYYCTSRDLGLRVVPHLARGSWNGAPGSLQRVVPGAQRSQGSLVGDAQLVSAAVEGGHPAVDWDSLHALAIEHYVTGMHDEAANVLVSRAPDGKLTYSAIDGERTFGRTGVYPRYFFARNLLQQAKGIGPTELSPALRARLRRTDVERWRRDLKENDVSPQQIEIAVQRLRAVQEHGLAALLSN
jgi:hypothetical protein